MDSEERLRKLRCDHCGEYPSLHRAVDNQEVLVVKCGCESPRRLRLGIRRLKPKSWRAER
ncbi:hypothetical protein ACEU6E_02995 [Halorutilales archaeon Cl-col2-1]